MARKRPESELVAALNHVHAEQRQSDIEARRAAEIAELTEQSRRNLEAKGLAQRPGESFPDWQRRTMGYFKAKARGIGSQDELS